MKSCEIVRLPHPVKAHHVRPRLALAPRAALHAGRAPAARLLRRRLDLSAEYLRVESPSAEVRGHSESERKTVSGKSNVAIRDVVPTGNYAARLVFDDGHETGIYTWSYLRELGVEREARWTVYLAELGKKGLRR